MRTIDDSRNEFIHAFKAYARAGDTMRDLLLQRDGPGDDGNLTKAVADQQLQLNESRERYQLARDRYVREILQGLGVTGTRPDPSLPLLEIRPPDKDIH